MKTLILERVSLDKNGTVGVEWRKVSSDGDLLDWHIMGVPKGDDLTRYIDANNAHLQSIGFDKIPELHVAAIRRMAEMPQFDTEELAKLKKE